MQNKLFIDNPPPPYKRQSDSIYLSDMDSNAWPSSYYGRSRRIDLAKFYHDILKASSNDDDQFNDCSSSSDEENSQISQNGTTTTRTARTSTAETQKKQVTFSTEPPMIYEYEPEFDGPITKNTLFVDDGWPGRTKTAMKSTGFIDFKSKIEAKLGAINDPSLISELDNTVEPTLLNRGYYRNRKSPLVQKLNLKPIPNHQPSLIIDSPSPSNSFTDLPLTPKDDLPIFNEPSVSNLSASSLTPGGSKWLNRTLSRMRNNNLPRIK